MAHSDGECNAFVSWTVFLSLKKRLLMGNKAIKRQNIIGLNVFTLINKLRYAQLIIEIWTWTTQIFCVFSCAATL